MMSVLSSITLSGSVSRAGNPTFPATFWMYSRFSSLSVSSVT